MRIASLSSFDASVAQLQRRQEALSTAQEKLTSGKRVLRPSDDPGDAARAERALAAESRANASQRALDASRNAMQLTESALGEGINLVQQARELMVGAGNGSYTDKERAINAQAIRGLRADLLALVNRGDGAGRFLFGGQGSDGPPFVDQPVLGVTYVATGGYTQAAAGEPTPLSLDGEAAWLQAPDPANPGATLSIFDVMDRVATELELPGRTSTEVALTVSTGLAQVDASMDNISGWRARAGEALNRIDGIGARLSQTKLDAQRDRSAAEDLDMVAAISDFQSRQSGYDAALKTYSIVQRMSLFEYVK